jgi:hypothetical protein
VPQLRLFRHDEPEHRAAGVSGPSSFLHLDTDFVRLESTIKDGISKKLYPDHWAEANCLKRITSTNIWRPLKVQHKDTLFDVNKGSNLMGVLAMSLPNPTTETLRLLYVWGCFARRGLNGRAADKIQTTTIQTTTSTSTASRCPSARL